MDEINNSAPMLPIAQRGDVSAMTPEAARAEYDQLARSTAYHGQADRLNRLEALSARMHGVEPTSPKAGQEQPGSGDPATDQHAAGFEAQWDKASAPISALDFEKALPGSEAAELRQSLFAEGVSPAFARSMALMEGHFAQVRTMDQATFESAVDAAAAKVRSSPGGDRVIEQAASLLTELVASNHRFLDQADLIATTEAGLHELARIWRVRSKAGARQ